jgi:hypothetical protein
MTDRRLLPTYPPDYPTAPMRVITPTGPTRQPRSAFGVLGLLVVGFLLLLAGAALGVTVLAVMLGGVL